MLYHRFAHYFSLLFVRTSKREKEREKERKGGKKDQEKRDSVNHQRVVDSFTVCCCSLHNLPSSRLLFVIFFFGRCTPKCSRVFSLDPLRSHAHASPVARLVYVVQKTKESLFFVRVLPFPLFPLLSFHSLLCAQLASTAAVSKAPRIPLLTNFRY